MKRHRESEQKDLDHGKIRKIMYRIHPVDKTTGIIAEQECRLRIDQQMFNQEKD
jgi:hypothetical protein